MVIADVGQVAVARDLAPTFRVLDQTHASTGELALDVWTRWDTAPIDTTGVLVMRGVTA